MSNSDTKPLTSRGFVIHIPSPSLACLLDDCGNCPSEPGNCTHSCHAAAPETTER